MNSKVSIGSTDYSYTSTQSPLSSQSFSLEPFSAFASCFSCLDSTLSNLNSFTSALATQTDMLRKISEELLSIETSIAHVQKIEFAELPPKKRKILKLSKTASRTPMHKILCADDTACDNLSDEVVARRYVASKGGRLCKE